MRFFLPLAAADLFQTTLPKRECLLVEESAGAALSELETSFEQALEDAAFLSLELVFRTDAAPCRIVAAGETSAGLAPSNWDQVESLHVDALPAESLIGKARAAETQPDLDQLTAEIMANPLEWFDISELPWLKARFRSS